jgi:hypothetical protein
MSTHPSAPTSTDVQGTVKFIVVNKTTLLYCIHFMIATDKLHQTDDDRVLSSNILFGE